MSQEIHQKKSEEAKQKSDELKDESEEKGPGSPGSSAQSSQVKIPAYMNSSKSQPYWTEDDEQLPSKILQKPVHPHNLKDAVVAPKDVAALSPEEVASILTENRVLLSAITKRLSSGQNLSNFVFDMDTSKIPQSGLTEKALDAIMDNPELARKALNSTLAALGRGVKKLSEGKALADELFGEDTGHLIREDVGDHVTSSQSKGSVDSVVKMVADSESKKEAAEKNQAGTQVLGVELPSFSFLNSLNPMNWLR